MRATKPSPYRAMRPFELEHAPYFAGRRREILRLVSSLFAHSLTVLHGPSGVGKTSLLHAGVCHELEESGRGRAIVFDDWHGDPLRELKAMVLAESPGERLEDGTTIPLVELLIAGADRRKTRQMLILDQFEDLLDDPRPDFVAELAELVGLRDLRVSVLIALRESALASLDRLEDEIPDLFGHLRRLDPLDHEAAQEAIRQPLVAWKERGLGGPGHAEDVLVAEILRQVAPSGPFAKPERPGGPRPGPKREKDPEPGAPIEASYLQLVIEAVWQAEESPDFLRLSTLEHLGGATEILRRHLDRAMASLGSNDRGYAARLFDRLVTPSGTGVPLSAEDLARYENLPARRIETILRTLSGSGQRILRAAPPAAGSRSARYEISHDHLAPAILDWRRRFLARRARFRRRLLVAAIVAGWLGVLFLSLLGQVSDQRAILASGTENEARARAAYRDLRRIPLLGRADHHWAGYWLQRSRRHALQENRDDALLAALQANTIEPQRAETLARIERLLGADYPLLERTLRQPAPIRALAAGDDGKLLVTGDSRGKLRTWDLSNDSQTVYLPQILESGRCDPSRPPIEQLILAPGAKTLLSRDQEGIVCRWDTETSEARKLGTGVTAMALAPGGQVVALGDGEGGRRLVTLGVAATALELPAAAGAIEVLVFGPTGRWLVSGARSGVVDLFELTPSLEDPSLEKSWALEAPVSALAIDPSGRWLLAGTGEGGEDELPGTHRWDLDQLDRPATRIEHQGPVTGIVVDRRSAYVTDSLGWLWRWPHLGESEARRLVFRDTVGPTSLLARCEPGPGGEPWLALAFGSRPQGGDRDHAVRLLSPAMTPEDLPWWLRGHDETVTALACVADRLISAGEDGVARIWRLPETPPPAGDRLLLRAGEETSEETFDDVALGGHHLAATDEGGAVWLWDLAFWPAEESSTTISAEALADPGSAVRIALGPEGRWLAGWGLEDLLLWRLTEGSATRHPTPAVRGGVDHLVFDPAGRGFATSSSSGRLLWWPSSAEGLTHEPMTFSGGSEDSERIRGLAISPDGRWLARTYGSRFLELWTLDAPGAEPTRLESTKGTLTQAAFTPDHQWLIGVGTGERSIQLWRLPTVVGTAADSGAPPEPPGRHPDMVLAGSPITALALAPQGATVATLGTPSPDQSQVVLWDLATGERSLLDSRARWLRRIRFASDGRSLLTVGRRWLHSLPRVERASVGESHLLAGTWMNAVAQTSTGEWLAVLRPRGTLLAVERIDFRAGHDSDPKPLVTDDPDTLLASWRSRLADPRLLLETKERDGHPPRTSNREERP